ncbi:MAG: hypothetical protein EOP54_12650 [Sphingobacteriales bacterium]|nr:MAG: hypothetical protein EOP54_12650 [Sphingobacteriales bacterium]
MFLLSCAGDEEALRPKINKYDLFKEDHPAGTGNKGLLSEAAATEKSVLVVKVNRLVLIDSSLKRGGSQYLYSTNEVTKIMKTVTRDTVLSSLLFISSTRFEVNVTAASPMVLFLDTIAAVSPLSASGVKYKWLHNAPVL